MTMDINDLTIYDKPVYIPSSDGHLLKQSMSAVYWRGGPIAYFLSEGTAEHFIGLLSAYSKEASNDNLT